MNRGGEVGLGSPRSHIGNSTLLERSPCKLADTAHSKSECGCVRSGRSEEHTSELQSLMRISYAVFCLTKKRKNRTNRQHEGQHIREQKKNIRSVTDERKNM